MRNYQIDENDTDSVLYVWLCLLFSDSVEQVVEKYGLQRVSMLRSFCMSVGIQILLREYNLDVKNKQIFNEEDIVNIFPVAKHIHPKVGLKVWQSIYPIYFLHWRVNCLYKDVFFVNFILDKTGFTVIN